MKNERRYRFTITEVSILLGKAPVTLRGWERDGIVSFPRNKRGDRRLTLESLREMLEDAEVRRRILPDRLKLIEATLTLLEYTE